MPTALTRQIATSAITLWLTLSCSPPLPPLPEGRVLDHENLRNLTENIDSLNIRLHELQSLNVLSGADYMITLRNLGKAYLLRRDSLMAVHFYRRAWQLLDEEPRKSESQLYLLSSELLPLSWSMEFEPDPELLKTYIRLASMKRPLPLENLRKSLAVLSEYYLSNDKLTYSRYYLNWLFNLYDQSADETRADYQELLFQAASLAYLDHDPKECRRIIENLLKQVDIPEDLFIRGHILAAKNARAEKAILRSQEHYRKVRSHAGLDLLYSDNIHYGMAENHFLLREFENAEQEALQALDISLTLHGRKSLSVARRVQLLEKIYDFSNQYEKLNTLRTRIIPSLH